jgi:hypothetical protein
MRRWIPMVLLLVLVVCSVGCARVKPWERDILANDVMTFDAEAVENALDHGYYNAREGAAGGFESGGGGCGCN